ncbi:MAG: hypothetical protein K2P59_15035 [Acetatifactor sp.]|jgi:hypothetical protein|nr:hypothetical protein [Acetatifactor sp.]
MERRTEVNYVLVSSVGGYGGRTDDADCREASVKRYTGERYGRKKSKKERYKGSGMK